MIWSPSKPGPSNIVLNSQNNFDNEDDDDDYEDSEPCCVCQSHSPPAMQNCQDLVIVNWAKCSITSCGHWVQLRFCHSKTSVARNQKFYCPCCQHSQSEQ